MFQPDGLGWRARIGLLMAQRDLAPDSEFQAMAPAGVSIHSTRVPLGGVESGGAIAVKIGPEEARAFADASLIGDAAGLLAANSLHAIAYVFTSGSYLLGPEGDEALKARLEQRTRSIPVVLTSLAAVLALRALGAQRLALIHPPWFVAELDRLGAEYFHRQGFDVVYHAPAELRTDY